MTDVVSSSPEIVRPSPSRRMTPEEEETFEKEGGLKENDVVLFEVIDPVRNCLLKRETLKVARVTDVRIAADTPLELKILKREEFFVDDEPPSSNETVLSKKTPKGGGERAESAKLDFGEAVKWTYDLLKNSTGINTEGFEASVLADGTSWKDYYGSQLSTETVSYRWKMAVLGYELAGVDAKVQCHYDAKPRSDTGIQGQYLANIVSTTTYVYATLAHHLSGKVSFTNKVNVAPTPDLLIPQMDVMLTFKLTTVGLIDSYRKSEFRINGARGVWRP